MSRTLEGRRRRRILVIGAGPGGICTGYRLAQAGYEDVTILEKSDGVGGTWWRNRYPGLSCDVPSHLYSFSFALKPDWARPYATQPEILAYMERCVDDLGLRPRIRLNTAVAAAEWDESEACWRVTTGAGEEMVADVLVSGQGMFGEPRWPDIPGRDSFAGTSFHTAQWRTDHPLAGERVAVIGSAASAVQLVPEVAKEAAQLHIFQRSANWVLPKEDTPYAPEQLEQFRRDPAAVEAERNRILERVGSFPFRNEKARLLSEQAVLANMAVVADPVVRAKLVPTVPWGCQRPLLSNDYYPTFNRPNVELVTERISAITPAGVVTADGRERAVDTIVYTTGYETTRYASSIDLVGRGGRALRDAWSEGAQAYLGITTSGFPNLFMLYGPNTNHGSIIYMIECQVDFVVRMLQRMDREGAAWVDVRAEAMAAYNEQIQRDLDAVEVWNAGCSQYYRGPSGRIVTQWPHSMFTYRDLTRAQDEWESYEFGTAPGAPVSSLAPAAG